MTQIPMSSFQRRIWLAEQLEPDLALYNVPVAWHLSQPLDPQLLRRALAMVVARHEILRTRFVDVDGDLTQIVEEPWQPQPLLIDLGAPDAAQHRQRLAALLREQAHQRFEVSRGQLLRVGLVRAEGHDQVLFLIAHHLVWDAGGEPVFLAELDRCYRAVHDEATAAPEPPGATERPATERPATAYPATAHQERMAFVDRFENGDLYDGAPVYHNLPLMLDLTVAPQLPALRAAVDTLAARHDAVRTVLAVTAAGVVARVLPDLPIPVDLLPDDDALTAWAAEPFDLARGPLLRVAVCHHTGGGARLALVGHAAVLDRASLAVLADDLIRQLAAQPPAPAVPDSFTRWYAARDPVAVAADLAATVAHLRGDVAPLSLPESRTRAAVHEYTEAWVLLDVPAPGGAESRAALLAAFAGLLSWYSGQTELLVGTVHDPRTPADAGVVGPAANLAALRLHLEPDDDAAALIRRCATELRFAADHPLAPFDEVVRALDPAKDMSRMALFDVLFQCLDAHPDLRADGLSGHPVETGSGYGKYDLHLFLIRDGDRYRGRLVYNGRYFDRDRMTALADHYATTVGLFTDDPTLRLDTLEPLTAAQRQAQIVDWNDTASDYPQVGLPTLLRDAARVDPDATALTHRGHRVGYRDLMSTAERQARTLIRAGVRPGELVALRLPRGVAQVQAVLAVLFAGAAYLPIEAGTPVLRQEFLLTDSGTRWLILDDGAPPAGFTGQVLTTADLDADGPGDLPPVGPDTPAYCIYTSGTTGQPKGVLISHRNVVRLLRNDDDPFRFGPQDTWTLFHSYAFDFAVWELFGCLVHSGRLVIVDEQDTRDPERFRDLLRSEQVTVLNQTPGAFAQLLDVLPDDEPLDALRYVIFGGQRLQPAMLARFAAAHPGTALVNMYGITEITVHATIRTLTATDIAENISTVGRPIPTTVVRLLDRGTGRRLLPVGAVGEIHVGGDGVAEGYLARPQLTAQRFVPDPVCAGRLFRSGDLARYHDDGTIEYVGRADSQVKIRGYRVEPGEIEARLRSHPSVADAVVLPGPAGTEHLEAFIRPADGPPDAAELRGYLAEYVPGHMIPAFYHTVERIPLTRNGKIDTGALRATATRIDGAAGDEPGTPTERTLAAIWTTVLGLDTVAVGDSFFEVGGHSLLATRLFAEIDRRLGVRLPLRELFEAPRLGDLADRVDRRLRGAGATRPVDGPRPDEELVPASPFQQRLWLAEQLDPGTTVHNVPLMWRVRGRLTPDAVRAALRAAVARHEILRTRFVDGGGPLMQAIGPIWTPEVQYEDLTEPVRTTAQRTEQVSQRLRREAEAHWDPGAGRLLRAVLLEFAPDDQVLFLCTHHLVCDGDSMRRLIREVAADLDAAAPVPVVGQYRDFVGRGWSGSGVDFWVDRLAGAPVVSGLPVVEVAGGHGAVGLVLAGDVVDRLRGVLAGRRVSWFMVVAAGVAAMLHRWTGADDVTFGCPVEDRGGVEGVLGPCLNTVVLRSRCGVGGTVGEVLAGMREMVLDAVDHQRVPFEEVVQRLNPVRVPGRTPYIDISVNADSEPMETLAAGPAQITPLWLPVQWEYETKFALTVTARMVAGQLTGVVSYRGDRYSRALVEAMARWLGALLNDFAGSLDRPVHALALDVAPPVPVPAVVPVVGQYRDFVGRGWSGAGVDFWVDRLAGAPVVSGLPVVEVAGGHGAVGLVLAGDVVDRLRGVLAGRRVSWFMVVAAGVAAMLHRWTGADDVTFGCPVEDRGGVEGVLGPCLNTVVLRSRCGVGGTVGEVLAGMREMVLDAVDHQRVPFEEVVQRLNPVRVPGRTPYIDISLAVLSAPDTAPHIGPATLRALPVARDGAEYTAKFALTVEFTRTGQTLTGLLAHRGDRYSPHLVEGMAAWLSALINDFDAYLDRPVHTLDPHGAPGPSHQRPTDADRPAGTTVPGPPGDGLERRIATVWQAVLRVPQVGAEDNFFDLGGTSLQLVVLRARLGAALGVEVSLPDLFKAPTVRAMALALAGPDTAATPDPADGDDARARAARARQARARRHDGR